MPAWEVKFSVPEQYLLTEEMIREALEELIQDEVFIIYCWEED